MKWNFGKYTALFLVLALFIQFMSGCNSENQKTDSLGLIAEEYITEEFVTEQAILESVVDENFISEGQIPQEHILEHLVEENGIYECRIHEQIISEAILIQAVVGETSEDELRAQLPAELEDYAIDWQAVIGKFAAGTAIIIVVGVVHYLSKGTTCYVFGSSVGVAKDALIGGAMDAAVNVVIKSAEDRTIPHAALKKYAIEGFADGFMWGAIEGALRVSQSVETRPKTLKMAGGLIRKIQADGTVVDDAGEILGKAYYHKDGTYLLDETVKNPIVRMFDSKGGEIIDTTVDGLRDVADGRLPKNAILQLGDGSEKKICKTDSAGGIFRVGDELLPNHSYKLNDYSYRTDQWGRVFSCEGDLHLKQGDRFTLKDVVKGALDGDDRGHLIGDRFGGSADAGNLVPMDQHINRSDYLKLENKWAKALENGDSVKVKIKLKYTSESFRPNSFEISYQIGDNSWITEIIQNAVM